MRNDTMMWVTAVIVLSIGAAAGCGSDVDGGGGSTSATGTGGGTSTSTGAGGAGGATSTGTGGGGAGGATGAGGAGGGMGASQACKDCFVSVFTPASACTAAVQACDGDAACNDWKNCDEDCFNANDTPACYAACDAAYPHDTALSKPLFDCLCKSCAAVCVAACTGQ